MRLLGDELEASAAGSHERADVWLVAWPKNSKMPAVIGWAYHTTNVVPGTASMNQGQVYLESRILWRQCLPLPELMKMAACLLAVQLELRDPQSVDGLLDAAVWDRTVFSKDAAPESVHDEDLVSADSSDGETETES